MPTEKRAAPVYRRYMVTGPSRMTGEFVRPSVSGKVFATLDEARMEARELHEQFGDAFAVWFRGRIVGRWGREGYVPLEPDFA